jgi:hypothetical protein
MTEQKKNLPEENTPQPVDADETLSLDDVFDEPPTLVERADVYPHDLDIAGALESVSALSDVLAEREEEERRLAEIARAEAEALAEAPTPDDDREPARIAMPPLLELRRGQPASVLPALLLIGVGGWLTFVFSTAEVSGFTPGWLLLAGAALGIIVLALLGHWVGSGRWSRGSLFAAVFLGLAGAAVYYDLAVQPGYGGALIIGSAGVALLLTGLLARPADHRWVVPGLVIIFAGLVALALAQGALPPAVLAELVRWSPLAAVIVAVLWVLPFIVKRRG